MLSTTDKKEMKTKEEILKWLHKHNADNEAIYEVVSIENQLMVNVKGNLSLCDLKIDHLPFQFFQVEGSVNISYNGLKSLKNSPITVTRNFDCSSNHLDSLEYSPQYVGNTYDCSNNYIRSCKGLPSKLRCLIMNRNKLESFESLKDLSIEVLNVNNNKLKNFKYCPPVNTLYSINNYLQSLLDLPDIKTLYILQNHFDLMKFWKETDGDQKIFERGDKNIKLLCFALNKKIEDDLSEEEIEYLLSQDTSFWIMQAIKQKALYEQKNILDEIHINDNNKQKNPVHKL